MISGLQENMVVLETVHDSSEITLEHHWEVMVTFREPSSSTVYGAS
jgi:hypothetical protein